VPNGNRGQGAVRIGILDTGYDRKHVAKPLYLEDTWRADADGWTHGWGKDQLWSPGRSNERGDGSDPTHGMGTIGILAGRKAVFAPPSAAKGSPRIAIRINPSGWAGHRKPRLFRSVSRPIPFHLGRRRWPMESTMRAGSKVAT